MGLGVPRVRVGTSMEAGERDSDGAGGAVPERDSDIRTFVIADVRGYTRFTQEHGDEAGARLAARFATVVREEIESSGGTLVELRGDEALTVFRSPRQALRAAVALQRRCAEELRNDPSLPLRIGAGIDAGEAVPVEGGYRGGALNLAARLCSLAKAGEVLVSEGAMLLARRVEEIEYHDRGRVELKGLREPVRYYQARFALDLPPEKRETGRWSRRRIGLAAGVAAAVAASAVLAVLLTRGGSESVAIKENALVQLTGAGSKVTGQRTFDSPPGGLAAGLGRVWVTDPGSSRLLSVLPGTSAADVALTGGHAPTAVAVAGGSVWVVNTDDSTVERIDAKLLVPVARVSVGAGASAIATDGKTLWVVNSDEGTVQRIDAATGRSSAAIGVGAQPVAAAIGLGSVWIADAGNGTLVQVDPTTNHVAATTPIGAGLTSITVAAGKVWVASGPEHSVTRFDPANPNALRTITISGEPTALTASQGAVWVATQAGSIERIDPTTLDVKNVRALGVPVAGLASVGNRLFVTTLSKPAKHRGGTLRLALDDTFDSVDPATSFSPQAAQLLSLTNDGLVGFRRVGGAAGTLLVPDLAAAIPPPSDGGKTYRFVLRSGIHYSGGQLVRASDVRHSLERALGTKQSPASFFLTSLLGAKNCGPTRCNLSAGIVADDASGVVTFHLTRPDPTLPAVLAQPFAFVLPSSVGSPRNDQPVPATGPYRIAAVSLTKSLVLERNPRFHAWSTQAQPEGFPDRIIWRLGVNVERQVAEAERGALDVALGPRLSTGARFREAQSRLASQVHTQAHATTNGFFMNTQIAPFDDLRVRRAVNYAIDRRRALSLQLGPSGAVVSCQILPRTIAGFRPYCPYGRGGLPGSGYKGPKFAQAQSLVTASGTTGERVTIVASPDTRVLSGYLAGVLHRLGYRAHVRLVSSEGYNRYINDSRHQVQIGFDGWVADYPAPADFLDLLFSCRSWKPGNPDATLNASLFCDQRVEHALAAARHVQAEDPSRAPLAWARVDRLVTDLAPWAVAWSKRDFYFVSKRVGDYQYNPQWSILLGQLWVR